MRRLIVFGLALLAGSQVWADTFTSRWTGKSFDGYIVRVERGGLTQVRNDAGAVQYVDPQEYDVVRNYRGRNNKVIILPIRGPIELICQTQAFEQAMVTASNQGPLFILVEIDSPGGKLELARRMADAILAAANCQTVAFVGGGSTRGAFDQAVLPAIACDKIFVKAGSAIGGSTSSEAPAAAAATEPTAGRMAQYAADLAEAKGHNKLLVQAMFDTSIEVIEVTEAGKNSLVDRRQKTPMQVFVKSLNEKIRPLQLNAAQAAQFGFAPGQAESRQGLLSAMEAGSAREVIDQTVPKAVRDFEIAQKRLRSQVKDINDLENQAVDFGTRISSIEAEILRLSEVASLDRRPELIRHGYYRYAGEEFQINSLVDERKGLVTRQTRVLFNLIRGYRRALDMTGEHPDLAEQKAALEKGLAAAQAARESRTSEQKFLNRGRYGPETRRGRMGGGY